jgi:hypothetical protein
MQHQVRSLAARRDAGLMERWPQARDGQALPVLQAFHEFLEVERRRTRAQMLALTGIFLLLLLCVAGAGILSGVYFVHSSDRQMTALHAQLANVQQQSGAIRAETEAKLFALGGDATGLQRQVDSAEAAMAALRSRMDAGAGGQSNQLAELRRLLAAVQQQNSALASGLKSIDSRLRTAPRAPAPETRKEKPEELASLPGDGAEPAGGRWIQVAVKPPEAAEKISLLLPIPE